MTIKAIETRYKGYRFRSRLEARWAVFFDALEIPYQYEPEGYDLGSLGWYLPDFMLWPDEKPVWFEVKGKKATAEEFKKMSALVNGTGIPGFISSGTMDVPVVEKMRKGKAKMHGAMINGVMPSGGWQKSAKGKNVLDLEDVNGFDQSMMCGFYEDCDGEIFLDHLYTLETSQFPKIDEFNPFSDSVGEISKICNALESIEKPIGVDARWIQKIDRKFNVHIGYNVGSGRWYRSKKIKSAYQKARAARFEHGEQG